jgi:hypothetical protein
MRKKRKPPTWLQRFGDDLARRWAAGESARTLSLLLGDLGYQVPPETVRYHMVQMAGNRTDIMALSGTLSERKDMAAMAEAVMLVMDDGRPRTVGDLLHKIPAPASKIRGAVVRMVRANLLTGERRDATVPTVYQKVSGL